MRNEYLAHHGVKGMKWGVRRDRRAANKARRRAERSAYKKEIANPGSQNAKAVSTKRIARGKATNLAGAVLLGREAVGNVVGLGYLGVTAANAAAGGVSAAAIGQAVIPMALGYGGVGIAAGVGAYKLAKRYGALDKSLESRTGTRAKAQDAKTYKRTAKEAGLKVNKDTVKNIKKGSVNLKDSQRDIQRRVKRKADIEDRAASNAAKVLGEMKSKQAAGTMTKEDQANFNKQLKDNSSDYYKQLRELGFK